MLWVRILRHRRGAVEVGRTPPAGRRSVSEIQPEREFQANKRKKMKAKSAFICFLLFPFIFQNLRLIKGLWAKKIKKFPSYFNSPFGLCWRRVSRTQFSRLLARLPSVVLILQSGIIVASYSDFVKRIRGSCSATCCFCNFRPLASWPALCRHPRVAADDLLRYREILCSVSILSLIDQCSRGWPRQASSSAAMTVARLGRPKKRPLRPTTNRYRYKSQIRLPPRRPPAPIPSIRTLGTRSSDSFTGPRARPPRALQPAGARPSLRRSRRSRPHTGYGS